ncbi:hypothetical protein [Lysobacter soli]|uniref:Nuclear transport factor 2 family protein n=1 Tax=Lysobacter soli TaxID=453783 RepID=A0A3D8VEN9_9GAMM|nr:hypothetical protein [Lysobacter soli]RDY67846.1 hypothetical protein DX912_08020 [Lysobacter soli]
MTIRPLLLRCLPAVACLLFLSAAAPAFAGDRGSDHRARGCARQFELAQRMDMESFRDYDAETFRAVHDERAITIFASGARRVGIDAIMTALASHFANREAQWTWTEVYRVVDGCNAAFILYETVYEIPRIGFRQHAYTGVTYSHDGHRWLAIADQGTPLP